MQCGGDAGLSEIKEGKEASWWDGLGRVGATSVQDWEGVLLGIDGAGSLRTEREMHARTVWCSVRGCL